MGTTHRWAITGLLLPLACVVGTRPGGSSDGMGAEDTGGQSSDGGESTGGIGSDADSSTSAEPSDGSTDDSTTGTDDPPPVVGGDFVLVPETDHGIDGFYLGAVDVADFDGDGRTDVVVSASWDNAFTPDFSNLSCEHRIRIYRNVSEDGGAIAFELADELPVVGCGSSVVRTGDFDGDGLADFGVQFRLTAGDGSGTTAGFFGGGDLTFERIPLGDFDHGNGSMGMDAVDIDDDGRDELVFLSSAPGLWHDFDPNAGTWVAMQTGFNHAITYGGALTTGDLDGDGRPELYVAGNAIEPFGNLDCSADPNNLMYAQVHRNTGGAYDPNPTPLVGDFPWGPDDGALPPYDPGTAYACAGSDNAGALIADLDADGLGDIVVAGSATFFGLPVYEDGELLLNGAQYDFGVLFNDGDFEFSAWERVGEQDPIGGTTNSGTGNVDQPNIAVGDLNGDGYPEIFAQGHHRDIFCRESPEPCFSHYIFTTMLVKNEGDRTFSDAGMGLPHVGEGGQVIADFNGDGRPDLLYGGATLPFHSNGANPDDLNTPDTLAAYVYRNETPAE